jgi:hypothetical protein
VSHLTCARAEKAKTPGQEEVDQPGVSRHLGIETRSRAHITIETAFGNGKQHTGAGQAHNRVQAAVERTTPFALLVQSLVIVWHALHGNPSQDVGRRLNQAPWRRTKTDPSYQDMAATLRRVIIAARDRATFDQVMDDLRRSQERHATDDPLITATALREAQLRGLVATHRVRQATKVLEQPRPPHEPATPQWRVIEQITVAAVLFATGDATTAEPLLCDAITAAERHRLPHQIQRALRTATGHSSTSVTAAAAALNRITTPTPEQRTGRRT